MDSRIHATEALRGWCGLGEPLWTLFVRVLGQPTGVIEQLGVDRRSG
jgi:hypothetical protein